MIIGFSGYARAGKSEAANALDSERWVVMAFADKLRNFLYVLNPTVVPGGQPAFGAHYRPGKLKNIIDTYGWDGYKDTPYNDEIRRLIQTLGTDCGRNMIGNNVWVDATFKGMNAGHIVDYAIQDVRFPNEAKAIKDRGGKVIRINKPGVGPYNNHESEIALDDWHFDTYIQNEGSIEDLHGQVNHVVEHYDLLSRVR